MRITKRQLKQIIREEAARLESKKPVNEANRQYSQYSMAAAKDAFLYNQHNAIVERMGLAIEDLYDEISTDLFDNETDLSEDEIDDMARAATVLAVAHRLGRRGFSVAEVMYDHLRRAGRR